MSLSADLCLSTVSHIVEALGLDEVSGYAPDAVHVLKSPMIPDAPVGRMRVFRRDGVCELMYIGLTVPPIGLDSHMLFAFSPSDSAVPHFTLDSVAGGGQPDARAEFAFHLDLIPRLDLGAHLGYLRHCFEPLTSIRADAATIDGLSPAQLSPTQYAVMSAWMLVNRATETAFREVERAVIAYRDHWLGLVRNGVPKEALDGMGPDVIAERDRRNRAIVFDPSVDPVWGRVAQLVGADMSEVLRRRLAGTA
ncbi:MAG: hypothetical protein ACKOJ9_09180 [Actinomycetota bacterium]